MIYRIAENCFWLQRYYKRVHTTACLLHAFHECCLDHTVNRQLHPRHHPILLLAGIDICLDKEQLNDEEVCKLLTWDASQPNSIISNLRKARENGNALRELIYEDSWITLNSLWLWINDPSARALYESGRSAFYKKISNDYQVVQGLFYENMRHDEVYHFMCIGVFIEKIHLAASLIHFGIRHLLQHPEENFTLFWRALLEGIHAFEGFSRLFAFDLSHLTIAQFLLHDQYFPSSLRFCLSELKKSLHFISSPHHKEIRKVEQCLYIIEGDIQLKSDLQRIAPHAEALFDSCLHLSETLLTEFFQVSHA